MMAYVKKPVMVEACIGRMPRVLSYFMTMGLTRYRCTTIKSSSTSCGRDKDNKQTTLTLIHIHIAIGIGIGIGIAGW
jgi:hypothetical protein